MEGLSATGEPAVESDDTTVDVGIDLRPGTLTLIRDGKSFEAYHARVTFSAPGTIPWTAQEVIFSAKQPDGTAVSLTVDLLNEEWSGPRDNVPAAVWKVVGLATTTAGDLGLTYSAPQGRP